MKAGLKTAEDELNLIKNQVQQTLLDIREHILDVTNPFNSIDDALTDEDEIEFNDLMGGGIGGGAEGAPGVAGASGGGGGGGGGGGEDGDGDKPDDLEDAADGDGEEVEELLDDALDNPVEEIIEEIPDDSYMGDEFIDDGGGMGGAMPRMSDPDEYFEQEEEIPEEIEEEFQLDEEPEDSAEDSNTPRDGADAAGDDADLEGEGGAFGALAPLTANFDVLTMAGLVRWVAVTTDRLGVNRTEIMLDAFEAAGRIPHSTRIVLHHLMALTEEDPSESVPVREIVSAMVRMEGVLDSSRSTDSTRLLSMLMDVGEDPLDLIA